MLIKQNITLSAEYEVKSIPCMETHEFWGKVEKDDLLCFEYTLDSEVSNPNVHIWNVSKHTEIWCTQKMAKHFLDKFDLEDVTSVW